MEKKSKVYAYVRFSTDKQNDLEQLNFIEKYCDYHNIKVDEQFRDEGVSGGVSYHNRNLSTLFGNLNEGDTLIVSELSRLTRGGIVELSEMVASFFKPRKIRLVIVNVNLDIDCTNLSPMVELQLSMMATFAKMEKQSIQERTKSALEARKKLIKEDGSFVSKNGNVITKLGRPKGCDNTKAAAAAGKAVRQKAQNSQNNKIIWTILTDYVRENKGKHPNESQFADASRKLNLMGIRTTTGLEMTAKRCRYCYDNMKAYMKGGEV